MVSLDDAVLARMEKGGKRYEVLVDPSLVEAFRADPASVDINDFLAMDEVFHDAGVNAPRRKRLKRPSKPRTSAPSPQSSSTKAPSN